MALQAIAPKLDPNSRLIPFSTNPKLTDDRAGARLPSRVNASATVSAEYYSSTKVALEYTSQDGDRVSFSFESLEFQRAIMEVDAEGSPEEMKNLIKRIKEEYLGLKKDLLKKVVESLSGKTNRKDGPQEAGETPKLQIPEYWNAENTSQRIVDFALSFEGLFEGGSEEFLKMMKGAIEEGFNQARDLLGDLPDEVSALVEDTHSLIMKKLDQWAAEKGINVAKPEDAAVGQVA